VTLNTLWTDTGVIWYTQRKFAQGFRWTAEIIPRGLLLWLIKTLTLKYRQGRTETPERKLGVTRLGPKPKNPTIPQSFVPIPCLSEYLFFPNKPKNNSQPESRRFFCKWDWYPVTGLGDSPLKGSLNRVARSTRKRQDFIFFLQQDLRNNSRTKILNWESGWNDGMAGRSRWIGKDRVREGEPEENSGF
jgi:hypothetical protein